MSNNFDLYSRYYDLLYRDKDYGGEADYVLRLIRRFHPEAKTLLDMGCGTGKHAALFRDAGYDVRGVDASETMLNSARTNHPEISFTLGDARSVDLQSDFDVVTSLFHVASYQKNNDDVVRYLANTARHLKPGGIFIFDFWHGPGVMSDPPSVRVKRLEDSQLKVTRIAEPRLYPLENRVDVHYHVLVDRNDGSKAHEIVETHGMRYFTIPELDYFLSSNGLHLAASFDWMSDSPPSADSWTACCVATRI